jgi:hypothetical protein
VARLRRTEVGLSEHELIVTREALEDLRDKIYVLEAAIEDVDRGDDDPQEALQWLLEAARPVVGRTLIGDSVAAADGSVPPIMSVMSDPPEVSR